MSPPIVTLITDFGLEDHYVGVMKGVILGICPGASLVDISHAVTRYEITQGAFLLAQAYPHFPPGTVHLVVVDPGVGTTRRPVLLQAARQFFVAPDNGVLTLVLAREEKHRVRAITAERYFRRPVSQTFHGRDIFAPVAAHLAAGVPPARFGKPVDDYLRREDFGRSIHTGKRIWTGAVLHIDHFGNMVTNVRPADIPGLEQGRPFHMAVGPYRLEHIARNYAECGPGEPFLIVGSSGYLEISLNQASAAKALGCGVGAPVEVVVF
ncbi:MAG TPA: SAM-dependent chlorinase/fluorinase [Bryobacteraceae bacterium]|nr:SAM-dependent chlorinase/fluorinase [Bryobacteraceae bacterium]